MTKGIIVYQSKYGATRKYAAWLQDMTGYPCVETPRARAKEAAQYETILLCGGVYASGIAGISFLKKNMDALKGKKLAVFCVGASPCDERALTAIKEHNLTGSVSDVPLFYGRGAWDESKMKLMDRTLCKMLQKAVAKRDPSTYEPWMQALMDASGQACDWTDKTYLLPLMEFLEK